MANFKIYYQDLYFSLYAKISLDFTPSTVIIISSKTKTATVKCFSRSSYVTGNKHNIPLFKTRHTFFKKSFFPSTNFEWNELDHNIRNSSSFNNFRKSILKFIRPSADSFFNCHNPKGMKFITRLRLGLSH